MRRVGLHNLIKTSRLWGFTGSFVCVDIEMGLIIHTQLQLNALIRDGSREWDLINDLLRLLRLLVNDVLNVSLQREMVIAHSITELRGLA